MPPGSPETPAFWACPKCKTPNPWASYLTNCVSCGRPRPSPKAAVALAPEPDPAQQKPPRKPGSRWLTILSASYLAVVLIVLAGIKLLGERWWPATILLFSPRWSFLFPIPLLAVWAGFRRKWLALGLQTLTAGIVLGPLMGLCIPWKTLFSSTPVGEHVRVLSLNRGTKDLDSKTFTTLVANGRYDIVCIQEFRPDPVLDLYFATAGWNRNKNGSIWTRFPIIEDLGSLSTDAYEVHGAWPVRLSRVRIRLKNGREALVASAHMPTMTYGFQHLSKLDFSWFNYYVSWRSRQTDELAEVLHKSGEVPVIVGGDFNMPPDSPFMKRLREHFPSSFEEAGWGYGYTRPSRLCWAGIDRVLASRDCRFVSSRVGPLVGSDHRPIDAEIVVLSQP